MKYPLLLLAICGSLLSCQNTGQQELLGKWQLTATLIDIGDGQGTYAESNSGKTIEFLADGSVVCNGTLCGIGGEIGQESKGVYTLDDGKIVPEGCDPDALPIQFQLTGDELILNYSCIEACGEKYRKTQ